MPCRLLVVLGLTALLAACASGPGETHAYKLYPGPARPPAGLAIVRMGDAGRAEFDGRAASGGDWTEVHLLPGEHRIRWQSEFGVSVMIEPSGFATGGNEARVTLAAGHVYSLRADRTTGPGYRIYLWIRDETTGENIAGEPKPE
jgi:hypothetical protein